VSVAVTQQKQFIGGVFVDSTSGETMEVLNPATGEVIAEVPKGTAEDVDRAVDVAKKAWGEWQNNTPEDRMELLLKLAHDIDDNAEELARPKSLNVGNRGGSRSTSPSDNLRFFAGARSLRAGRDRVRRGRASMIRREPLGIVAGICPWNYPLFMAMWKIGPALAAGNVQIIKPAEQTPLTMLRFVELAQDVIPPGVLQVVTGDGIPVGDALVRHADVRLVSLTGDTATGKIIAKNAADTVKRLHLELGGKAPMGVLDGRSGDVAGDQDRRLLQLGTGLHRVLAHPRERVCDDVLSATVTAVES
jgi:acyl-CoA reductase-like NAD-dependent aldehyde dehydrogenase